MRVNLDFCSKDQMTVDMKRELEQKKLKLMTTVYVGNGIKSLNFEELKFCFDNEIISLEQFEK